jgi:hypothetical protein
MVRRTSQRMVRTARLRFGMMKAVLRNFAPATLALLSAVVLLGGPAVGCASTGQHAKSEQTRHSVTFQAPDGWTKKQPSFGPDTSTHTLGGMWSSGTRPPQIVAYGYGPLPASLGPIVDSSPGDERRAGRALEDLARSTLIGTGSVVASHPINLCRGKRPGWYVETISTLLGLKTTNESVYLLNQSVFATASYSRPYGSPANPMAERSLTTLCLGR